MFGLMILLQFLSGVLMLAAALLGGSLIFFVASAVMFVGLIFNLMTMWNR
jgi:hypothetical protein